MVDLKEEYSGERLQAKRNAIPMTQLELAQAIGASKQSISNWERGTKKPLPKHIRAMRELFSKSVSQ